MTHATCQNCGLPIVKDKNGWFHTRLPLKDGQPDTNPDPCRAMPDRRKNCGQEPPQRDLFEVNFEP